MNVIVIGLGSMGKRRIRLLNQYIQNEINEEKWTIIGVDANEERCNECAALFGITTYFSLDEARENEKIDCAIISTAPCTHEKIIHECISSDFHVFTELNLIADGYDENVKLASENDKVLFLSSTFLYRKEIQFIKKRIQERNFRGSYRYHVGQYLPEWHPWESYKKFFVSDKRTNGCREIFSIELPWIIDTFGEIVAFKVVHNKVSSLEIEYDDTYQLIVQHANGVIGNLSVDIVTPKTGRELEIWEENFYIGWKGTPDTLEEYDLKTKKINQISLYDSVEHEEGYNKFVVENAYYDELVNYFRCIKKMEEPKYSFEKDKIVLMLIDEIEK